jgi:hypothetical protein
VIDTIRDRVVPPDVFNSDGSEAKDPPGSRGALPPWDKMRYVWRGELKVRGRSTPRRQF